MPELPRLRGRTPGGLATFIEMGVDAARQGIGGARTMAKLLRGGAVCTGCSLGMCGSTDELGDFHLCYQGLRRLGEVFYPDLPDQRLADVAALRGATNRELTRMGRVTIPLLRRRGDRGFRPVNWNTALDVAADAIAAADPDRLGFYLSGRSSNESIYVTQLFARLLGTNNADNCSRLCHAPSAKGLMNAFGAGSGTSSLSDVHEADLIFVIGSNTPGQHPRLVKNLAEARQGGADIVCINPIVERGLLKYAIPSDVRSAVLGSDIASDWYQVKPGGDTAVVYGIVKTLLEEELLDAPFLTAHTEGWDAFADAVRNTDWPAIEARSGISADRLRALGRRYGRSQRTLVLYCMGVTHHTYGTDTVQAIANLMLARGMVGRPGTGIIPIRGHSNVQGAGEMLMVPALTETMLSRLEQRYDVPMPQEPGLTLSEMIWAAHDRKLDVLYMVGGNLLEATPDTGYTRDALERVPLLVSQTIHLNRTHLLDADCMLILPAQPRHEQEGGGTVISNWRQVRYSPALLQPRGQSWAEWRIVTALARKLADRNHRGNAVGRLAFDSVKAIQEEIAAVLPQYERMATLQPNESFRVGDASLHADGEFATANGKARVKAVPLPDNTWPDDAFMLITVRADGQFNTEVTHDRDALRESPHRNVVLMHADDAQRLGVREGDPVRVTSDVGELTVACHCFDIRPGVVAMYFPEANVLVPWGNVDTATKTPNFKGTVVRLARAGT